MALVLDVTLISGKRVSLEAGLDASVQSLKKRARGALGVGLGRLFNASGSLLDGDATLEASGLRTGDCLILQISEVQISSTQTTSFAAILGDGSVVTWGYMRFGGDSSAVEEQLKNVQHIQALVELSPLSLAMGLWSHGATCGMVATAVLCKIS